MPSLADLEQWMEAQLPPNLHDLPMKVTASVQSYSSQLYAQLTNLTPSYSQIESSIESSLHSIPFVGHAVTTSPPPPPPPTSMVEALMKRADELTGSRTRTSIAGGIGLVGITFAVLSRSAWLPNRGRQSRRGLRWPRTKNGVRQEAVIVLGGDTALGQSLCHHLSAQGFIVLASVASEQSMQAFDSLILPSSRGYIKSIILDPLGPRAEEINYFVRSVASARELRWPLTSAGDPYSRPGTEVEVAGLINALSYHAVEAASTASSTSLHVDTITRELNEHVITPLAVISALLPLLELGGEPSTVAFVVSLTASPKDLAGQALLAGMQQLKRERAMAPRKNGSHARRILLTTVEAQPTSLRSLFLSLLPSSLGGRAPLQRRQEEALAVSAKGQSEQKPIRPRNVPRHSSTSDFRLQRESEHRAILEAVTSIVLLPSTTTRLRSKYIVRLPTPPGTPALDSEQVESPGLERTVLLQIARLSLMPFALLGSGLTWIGLRPSCWLSSWTLPGSAYHGSRNAANSRPAYGPGPGPASNTHSRSCIRRGSEKTSNTRQPSRRPTSANSTSSSDAARSNERSTSGSGPSSTATASGPPSNNGLSSSGLLSSVPSSTFGDASEEDHYDYDEEVESPIHGSTHWASPVLSDRDSDTALGARPQDYDGTRYNGEETTPSASRLVQSEGEVQYGFPSQASMQSTGDEAWMGPTTQVDEAAPAASHVEGSDSQPAVGTQSPLGQSWVALGQSEAR